LKELELTRSEMHEAALVECIDPLEKIERITISDIGNAVVESLSKKKTLRILNLKSCSSLTEKHLEHLLHHSTIQKIRVSGSLKLIEEATVHTLMKKFVKLRFV